MTDEAVFIAREPAESGSERLLATDLARGPWDPLAQHGGAAAAILMRAFERLEAAEGLAIARVTYELMRPVPLGELDVEAHVMRRGRRVQLLEGAIRTAEGTEVVRARALQVRPADPSAIRESVLAPPPGPERGHTSTPAFTPLQRPTFFPDSIEIRFVSGEFGGGPATAWFRLRVPIVAGEEASPLQRLAAAADFGNGISTTLSWDEYLFINPDLTVYIERPPVGEWVCLDARTILPPGGVATAESVIYDERGRVGRAVQSLLVAPR